MHRKVTATPDRTTAEIVEPSSADDT